MKFGVSAPLTREIRYVPTCK